MEHSEEDLAQLRFLFWRHLNWQQRLKVLVAADVLPASADKPVPQTLERLAIETAKAHGKLAVLWDAMTPLLPEDKRQPNPSDFGYVLHALSGTMKKASDVTLPVAWALGWLSNEANEDDR